METKEIKQLLQRYFSGESTIQEEKLLQTYFLSEKVADEVAEYAEFFGGVSELAEIVDDSAIEEEVMDYILENEHLEKTKFKKLWINVTGIAASVIIVLGGFLFYQQQQKPFEDTFDDPDQAYAYAEQTLKYVSGKYSKGLTELENFEKLQKASKPLQKGIAPVNDFFRSIASASAAQDGSKGSAESAPETNRSLKTDSL